MAYRRKHGTQKASTFEDFSYNFSTAADDGPPASLAAQAIRASAAHRESSHSSAYGDSAFSSSVRDPMQLPCSSFIKDPFHHEYSDKNMSKSKDGFWGVLARKAKLILEEGYASQQFDDHGMNGFHILDASKENQFNQPNMSPESNRKVENLAYSLNHIGGTIRNALEEGLTIVENRTADIIHETKKLQIRRKSTNFNPKSQITASSGMEILSQNCPEEQSQLKTSRNAAYAVVTKAKLLIRELKTLKADLAFSKERCSQLEEENKVLRENRQKGDNSEDDDLIRLQLETLLAEKARLAHENSICARENRFLREIVEFHKLTIEDDSSEVENIQISSPHSSHSPSEIPPSPAFFLAVSDCEEGSVATNVVDSLPRSDDSPKGVLSSSL